MADNQLTREELIKLNEELKSDLRESIRQFCAICNVFGIDVRYIKETKMKAIAKNLTGLAMDMVMPGNSLESKFKFLEKGQYLIAKYGEEINAIQEDLKAGK